MKFRVLMDQDEDGFFVGEAPQLKGCYSQGRTLDELMENIREVILCLEEESSEDLPEFVGIQKIEV